jgi:hypothetical protein
LWQQLPRTQSVDSNIEGNMNGNIDSIMLADWPVMTANSVDNNEGNIGIVIINY